MRKQLLTAMVLAAAVSMAACGHAKTETAEETSAKESTEGTTAAKEIKIDTETTAEETAEEQTEEAASEEETQETTKAGEEDDELPKAYQEILDKYRTMIQEKWELDQVFEENLSGIVADLNDIGSAAEDVGYFLYDLDQDGSKELLIGEMDNDEPENRIIFDAYTLVNGKAEQIFESESRNRYYLVEDESGAVLIANEASNGAANSGWLYYVVNGASLNVVQSVIYDATESEENPWYMSTDDDWDVSNDEAVDEDTAISIIDSYTENYVKLDWMPVID